MTREKVRAAKILATPIQMRSHARLLGRVGKAHFNYFLNSQDKTTGLVLDRSTLVGKQNAPSSIAATGFSLAAYACAVKRGWVSRSEAVAYTLRVLSTLWSAPQGDAAEGTSGNHGFFYHFLDPATGLRATAPKFWHSELSSIDTALLMAGVLFARNNFRGKNADEAKIRELATNLFERVEWNWLAREDKLIRHGWTPENGFIEHVYQGYSEALLLYILANSSPTHPAPKGTWEAFLKNATLADSYGITYVKMPGEPLFCYQYPHAFIDFRDIQDDFNRRFGFDWYENSRRMSWVHYHYAQENPLHFTGYGGFNWGLTASDGPGGGAKEVDGRVIEFRAYSERGAPSGFDDGTIAPTAALSAMPYVPQISIPTLRYWLTQRPELFSDNGGFTDAFNPTFDQSKPSGWVDRDRIGIDQGPIVLMMENFRSGLIWSVMRRDQDLRNGLAKAGFKGGWLESN